MKFVIYESTHWVTLKNFLKKRVKIHLKDEHNHLIVMPRSCISTDRTGQQNTFVSHKRIHFLKIQIRKSQLFSMQIHNFNTKVLKVLKPKEGDIEVEQK